MTPNTVAGSTAKERLAKEETCEGIWESETNHKEVAVENSFRKEVAHDRSG